MLSPTVAEGKKDASDPDADWGKHETSGANARTGKIWKKVKSWFGYGLHLIADTHYEVPVAFEVTRASRTETKVLAEMLEGLFAEAPEMVDRCDDFSADRGLDNAPQKKQLWDKWTIRPLIDTRLMWKAEKEEPGYDPERPITRPLFPERADVIVHDERGRVSCICPETGEVRAMAFQGFEAERGACGTIKYRCPATAFGFNCAGHKACHRAGGVKPGEYGRIVRVDLDKHDRRIFTPTPWGSPSWRRGYNRRSAMERINSRLDNSFNFETHYIRGLAKMKTRVGLALAVMMALALGQVAENVQAFLPVFKNALVRRGVPARLYVDNGAAYRSRQLALVCAKLGIALVHARAYQPAGKGKIERFFRTLRAGWLAHLEPEALDSLETLNRSLWAWIEGEYHNSPHRGIERRTPLEQWALVGAGVRYPEPTLNLDEIFLFEARRRVQKDRTVSLDGRLYEVDPLLVGRSVTLRYDPDDAAVAPPRRRL